MAVIKISNYLGEDWVPPDIRRRRKWNLETMKRLGAPVLVKHMFTDRDAQLGVAVKSPGMDDVYGQPRHDDPLSHGVGYVSAELSNNEWYNTSSGQIVVSNTSPGAGWVLAPKYRGFGPGYLTYVIEPDVAEDVFKVTEAGVLIQTQQATAQAPWFPEINDNDLLINVVLDRAGNIAETKERFQAKMTNPISMRGHQRRGRREHTEDGGNRFMIGQQFQMTLIPKNDALYRVEVDR